MAISPSNSATILLTMESPNPVPLEREFSCAKGVKSFDLMKSLDMPLPVSVIVNVTHARGIDSVDPTGCKSPISVASSLILTYPREVYFKAFPSSILGQGHIKKGRKRRMPT
jgi:hypothetical protein